MRRGRLDLFRVSLPARRSPRIIALALVLASLSVFSEARTAARLEVRWADGRLSVTAEAPLADILDEIGRRTGLEIRGHHELREDVAVRFSDVSLAEGLRRIFRDRDYVLVEELLGDGRSTSRRVQLFGRGSSVARSDDLASEAMTSAAPAVTAKEQTKHHRLDEEMSGDALRIAMSNPDPSVQATALELLAGRHPEAAVPLLIEGTQSRQPEVRLRALDLLVNGSAPEQTIMSVLGGTLAADDAALKSYAIRALARRGGPEAMMHLRQSLRDSDPAVRALVVDTIVRTVPVSERIPLLEDAAMDGDEAVRSAASTWLKDGVPVER